MKRTLIVFLTAVAILFSYWTYERNKIWKNDLTLWTDIQKKSPNKARANLNLGLAYIQKNRLDEAIPVLEKALYLYEQLSNQGKYVKRTDTSLCLRSLGNAFWMRGEYKKAIEHLDRALKESSNTQ
jgi:tetratricopeptide (TPR) repeat protein